jgi:SAM-dependent methyltransferase
MQDADPTLEAIAAHDRQRYLPEPAFRDLIAGLADRLRPHQPCLDAGAGSGMITIPLARDGVTIAALDRSPAMLARLAERAAEISDLTIVRGDMTALPFADRTFGSVLIANVFHLIAAWEQALAELVRVVRQDGILLVNLGGAGTMPDELARLSDHFFAQLDTQGESPQPSPGPASVDVFETAIHSHSLVPEAPIVVEYDDVLTPEAVIQRLEGNSFARPGAASDEQVGRASQASRDWARQILGSLDRPFPRIQRIVYHVYTHDAV